MSLFHRHRVRASFYHIGASVFLFTTWLYGLGVLSEATCFYITSMLFVIDYLAEMYDPHPENPGPWFKSHFHRFFDDDLDENGDGSPDKKADPLIEKRDELKERASVARKLRVAFEEKGHATGIHSCGRSPIGKCVYDHVEDPCMDECIFCHEPRERK